MRNLSLTSRAASFLSGEFLLHIPCWLPFYLGSFSYTSRAGFSLIHWPSLTHPMLVLYLPGEFLLHIPCWLNFYLGSFSYTSHAGFIFMQGVSYTSHADSFYVGSFSYTSRDGFPFYQLRFSYTFRAGFIFIWGVFLTHHMLVWFFCGVFLWHIPWRLLFLILGVSLTHPCCFHFYLRNLS